MVEDKMKIALDAMGGDRAPDVMIQGAFEALGAVGAGLEIVLVGDTKALETKLAAFPSVSNLSIVEAPEVVEMHEPPIQALRRKKGTSIAEAMRLQKRGAAHAVISAGNTGAAVASSLLTLGRLSEVNRPAIASPLPTERGYPCIVLDVGANAECKPINLFQFAVMGSLYMEYIFGVEHPKVGLLSIGEESSKGNDLTVETYRLLSESSLNFIGNVEGRDILRGTSDVVVCDGFVGNVVLKLVESILGLISSSIQKKSSASFSGRLGALLMKPVFREVAREMNYEEYGGAPLLGIDGVTIICHGSSSPKAISKAIEVAVNMVARNVNDHIKENLWSRGVTKVEAGK